MTKAVLIRYGEIALKGKNRINFEDKLANNIKKNAGCRLIKTSGRFIAYLTNNKDTKNLKKVFGITSLSSAEEVYVDIEKIKEEALIQAKSKKFSNFRITVQRLHKKLKTSPELEREIGAFIVEKTGKKVKLKGPDLTIFIEIADKAYVFTEKTKCFGGLPTGIEGNVVLLIDSKLPKNNSLLAGLLMMRRGCDVYPFSQKKTDIKLLDEYGSKKISIGNYDDIDKFAEKNHCRAIAIGQTLDNISGMPFETPALRPLVAYNIKEISKRLKEFK